MKKLLAIASVVSAPLALALLSTSLPGISFVLVLLAFPLLGTTAGLLGLVLLIFLAQQQILECFTVEVTGQCLLLM